ncbi:hypothetical protein PTTG_02826, partial [Puccinia triticina 1-1 BBBD Race 1]
MELLENMADKLKKTPEGKQAWSSYVLQEQFIEHNTTEGDESNNVGLGAMDEDPTEARGLNLEEIGTRMFHGTWGYAQFPSAELLETLDASELTMDAFNEAMKKVPSFQIEPRMFLPTPESEESYKAVWKSQIARVLHEYIAQPQKNSAEGMGQVLDSIALQTGLNTNDFFGRLQL